MDQKLRKRISVFRFATLGKENPGINLPVYAKLARTRGVNGLRRAVQEPSRGFRVGSGYNISYRFFG